LRIAPVEETVWTAFAVVATTASLAETTTPTVAAAVIIVGLEIRATTV
jgi:hypothetical protein